MSRTGTLFVIVCTVIIHHANGDRLPQQVKHEYIYLQLKRNKGSFFFSTGSRDSDLCGVIFLSSVFRPYNWLKGRTSVTDDHRCGHFSH